MWLDPLLDFRFEWTTVQCSTRSGMWPSVYSPERHTSLASLAQECWWSNLINNSSYFISSSPHSLLQDIWSALTTPPRGLKSTPPASHKRSGSNLPATVTSRYQPWPLPWFSCLLSQEDPGENLIATITGETHYEWPTSGILPQPLSHQSRGPSVPSSNPELPTPLLIPSMTPNWLFVHKL